MSEAQNPARWTIVRRVRINLAATGMGCGIAINMADEIPPAPYLPLMIATVGLNGARWGLLLVGRRYTGQALPRCWTDKPQPPGSGAANPSVSAIRFTGF